MVIGPAAIWSLMHLQFSYTGRLDWIDIPAFACLTITTMVLTARSFPDDTWGIRIGAALAVGIVSLCLMFYIGVILAGTLFGAFL